VSEGRPGAWGSALTAGEFAAVRSAGFEPVGQVFGTAVYSAGAASGSSCPGTRGPSPGQPDAQQGAQPDAQSGVQPGVQALVQAMYQVRHAAIERMTAECAALGGHGVVGVRLSRGSFPLGGLEFTAIGTAVRAPQAAHGPPVPFTCDLSGQDFARLFMTGWVPAGLVLGISILARHDDQNTARQTRPWSRNAEVAVWSELVTQSRHDARSQLENDVTRLGAEGVVIAAMQLEVSARDCPEQVGRRDHIVEATMIGTAVASFSRPAQPRTSPPRPVISVTPPTPNR
jgi:uncharacterized protein YbjQ (UPF0145 family)